MIDFYIHSFSSNKKVFKDLLSELSPEIYTWKESADKWSMLEVVCHLYDEEREDFRARLTSVLNDPTQPFISIDPQNWPLQRNYADRNYEEMLEKFLNERHNSVNILNELRSSNWNNSYQHPQIGAMSGSFIIANWLAHDYLHIRQIVRIKYNYLKSISQQNMNYAGEW